MSGLMILNRRFLSFKRSHKDMIVGSNGVEEQMFEQSHFVPMVRYLCCQLVMFREKNESDCKNNELLLVYNMETKENLYLNHMLPAAEALGKVMVLGAVKLRDQSGQCTNADRVRTTIVFSVCGSEIIQSTNPGSQSLVIRDPKSCGCFSSARGDVSKETFFERANGLWVCN